MSGQKTTPSEPTPREKYCLQPSPCQQVEQSRRMIAAAAETRSGHALVLGAGHCAEIPLGRVGGAFRSDHD